MPLNNPKPLLVTHPDQLVTRIAGRAAVLRVTTEYGLCKRAAAPPATDKLAAGLARCTRADRVWADNPATVFSTALLSLASLVSGRQRRGLLLCAVRPTVALVTMTSRVAADSHAVATTVPTAHRLRAVTFLGRNLLDQLPQSRCGVRERRIDLIDRHVSDSGIPPYKHSLHVRILKGDLELRLQMLQVEERVGIPRGCVTVPLPGEGDDAELGISRSVRSRDKPLCLSQVASDVRRIQVWGKQQRGGSVFVTCADVVVRGIGKGKSETKLAVFRTGGYVKLWHQHIHLVPEPLECVIVRLHTEQRSLVGCQMWLRWSGWTRPWARARRRRRRGRGGWRVLDARPNDAAIRFVCMHRDPVSVQQLALEPGGRGLHSRVAPGLTVRGLIAELAAAAEVMLEGRADRLDHAPLHLTREVAITLVDLAACASRGVAAGAVGN